MIFKKQLYLPFIFCISFYMCPAYSQTQTKMNLAQIYKQAKNNSAEFKSQYYTFKANAKNVDILFGKFLPKIDIKASTAKNYNLSHKSNYNNYSASVNLSQVLFDYSLLSNYNSYKENNKANSANYNQELQSFIANVAISYFSVLKSQSELKNINENIQATKTTLDEIRNKYEEGMVKNSDYQIAKANYYGAIYNQEKAKVALTASINTLETYTNNKNYSLKDIKPNTTFNLSKTNNLKFWIDTAFKNNPSLKAYAYKKQSSAYNVSSIEGSFLPSINLNAAYTRSYNASNPFIYTGISKHNNQAYIGVSLNWNIFNGASDYKKLQQANLQEQSAIFDSQQIKNDIKQTVTNYYFTINSMHSQIKALKQALEASKVTYEETNNKFKAGIGTTSDLVNKLQAYYNNLSLLSSLKYSLIISEIKINEASGTLSNNSINKFNQLLS